MQSKPSSPSKSPKKSPRRSPSPKKVNDDGDEGEDLFADFDFRQAEKLSKQQPAVQPVASNSEVETQEKEDPQELILLYEAKTRRLENEMAQMSQSLQLLRNEKQNWEASRVNESAKLIAVEKQVAKLKEELLRTTTEKHLDTSASLQWSREKEELELALQTKIIELKTLSNDIEQKSESLLLLKQELSQEKEKISALEAIETSNRALISSQEVEVAQLTKMTDWLNQELSSKSSQLLEYRKEKSTQLNRLQADLETVTQEKFGLESRAQYLQKRSDDLESKLESKMEQLRESENRQISNEQQFLNEMASQKKLTELYKGKAQEFETHNLQLEDLVRDLESKLDRLVQEQTAKEKESQAEFQKIRESKEAQELELEQLRSQLQLVNSGLIANARADQIAHLSETASVASRISNSGKSFTQVYADYTKLQQDMIKEKSEVARLTECLNSIVKEFEHRAPMIQKTNEEYEKAKAQVERLSINLSNAVKEKNQAIQNQTILQKTIESLTAEQNLLQKEIEDRSRQVQACLREQELLKGAHSSTLPEEEFDDSQLSGADSIIAKRLIVFKNIEELQSQNQALIRSIRSISAKMEAQERLTATQADEERLQALTESKNLIDQLQEQLRRESLNAESYAKERDQWRRIAESRTSNRFTPAQSPESSPPRKVVNPEIPSSAPDYEQFYRELQREFDVYRKESGTDTKLLKTQLESTQLEKTELSIQVAKLNNQITYLNERHELLISSSLSKEKEFEQLRERLADINQTATRQDIKIEELSNALLQSRQSFERLSAENQQFKVEKQIWKASESRILKESQDIARERNTANDRIRELQNHMEEKDRKTGTKIKRMEDQLDELTRELALSRKQVSDLMDDHRTLTSRRDAELRESQIKIQKLTVEFERAKGDLALAQNKEQNATSRVKELQAKVSSLEQRSVVFDSRIRRSLDPDSNEGELPTDLESDLRQVKIELEAVKAELEIAKDQAETYRSISQASEERLAEMTNTADAFKAEIEAKNEELLVKLRSVEADKDDLELRLTKLGETLSETQEKMDAQSEEYASAKELYEKQISSLRQNEEQALKAVAGMKVDLARQVKLANDSRENYEREVISHSTAIQAVASMKEASAALAAERDNAVSEKQIAVEKLAQVESSFDNIQAKLKQDLKEMEDRVEDLKTQNALLHSQFEQLSISRSQIGDDATDVEELGLGSQKSISDLSEVIKFLRREKDIVETKLQISLQEQERSRVQLEHLQKSLDETRTVLEEERLRGEDRIGSNKKHQELLEKIEQTNLLRESNITLRSQLEAGQQRIDALAARLKDSELQIEPLREQLSQLESEVEARKAEGRALLEDNARWKGRAQQILEKYERIDPVEHDSLKTAVATLTAEKANLEAKLESMQSTIEGKIKEKSSRINALETELAALKKTYESAIKQKEDELIALKDPNSNEELVALRDKLNAANEEISVLREKVTASSARNKDIAKQANEKIKARIATIKELNEEIEVLKEDKKSAEERMKIAILETEKKLAAERQATIASITTQWEARLNSLQNNQLSSSTGNTPQLETPSKRKSLENEPSTQIQESDSPAAKRVRINDEPLSAAEIPDYTQNAIEDEIQEDGEEFNLESSQAELAADQEPADEDFEAEGGGNDLNERDDSAGQEGFGGDLEEDANALINDGSVESVKSVDLGKDDHESAPGTPAAVLESNVEEDFVGTPEASVPAEATAEENLAPAVSGESEASIEPELKKNEPSASPSVAFAGKQQEVFTKPPPDVSSTNKPVSIQRPAAASPSTAAPKVASSSPVVASPAPVLKKEITLKKESKTPAPGTEVQPKTASADPDTAGLKLQKTLLLQKKLEALRAVEGDKANTQKPRLVRNPQASGTGAVPARGSGRGRATISIRGSRGRGQPPKS